MLRKRTDGRLERLRPDGSWQEVPEHEQPEGVRRAQVVDWSQLSDLFDDGADAGPARDAGTVAAGADAAGDVDAAGHAAGAGRSTVVRRQRQMDQRDRARKRREEQVLDLLKASKRAESRSRKRPT